MNEDVEVLAQRILAAYSAQPTRRLLVAVAGRPGSGKSTLAYPLTDRINELLLGHAPSHPAVLDADPLIAIAGRDDKGTPDIKDVAICVGQDGWHYSRAELDAFDDPKEAHWRRGAAFTFNLPSYTNFLQALRSDDGPVPFPTFDHAAKDPAPSPINIEPHHRIVILEGLYTMYDEPGWRDCAKMMDMRVWFEVPRQVVFARVMRRNVAAGIVSADGAAKRVEAVDMANGDEVAQKQYEPTVVVNPKDVGTL